MTWTKQTIGNRGVPPQASALPGGRGRPPYSYGSRRPVQTRSLTQGSYADSSLFGNYPGLGGAELPVQQAAALVPQAVAPAQGGGGALSGLASIFGGGGSSAGGSGSGFNIQQIKQVVDRLGGIDGIVDTFGKMQKMVQSVQQMAPMVKLLMGSFGKGKKAAAEEEAEAPRRRRRRKRKTAGARGRKRRSRR